MHSSSPLLLNIYSHFGACAGRATCVTLAHSAAAKNIPSDIAVMQQPRVIGAFAELTVHVQCVDRLLGLGMGNWF